MTEAILSVSSPWEIAFADVADDSHEVASRFLLWLRPYAVATVCVLLENLRSALPLPAPLLHLAARTRLRPRWLQPRRRCCLALFSSACLPLHRTGSCRWRGRLKHGIRRSSDGLLDGSRTVADARTLEPALNDEQPCEDGQRCTVPEIQ